MNCVFRAGSSILWKKKPSVVILEARQSMSCRKGHDWAGGEGRITNYMCWNKGTNRMNQGNEEFIHVIYGCVRPLHRTLDLSDGLWNSAGCLVWFVVCSFFFPFFCRLPPLLLPAPPSSAPPFFFCPPPFSWGPPIPPSSCPPPPSFFLATPPPLLLGPNTLVCFIANTRNWTCTLQQQNIFVNIFWHSEVICVKYWISAFHSSGKSKEMAGHWRIIDF